MTPTVFSVIAAAVIAAALIQGTTGVGFALVVAPVMGLLAPELLPVCLLALMIPLNVYVAWRERAALDRSGAGWILLGRFAGTFAGVALLAAVASRYLNLLIGSTTVLAVAATLLAPSFNPGRRSCIAAGLVTGVTETATGIGGPPLALVYQHQAAPVLRATLAFCFLLGQVISLASLAVAGRSTASQFAAAAMLLPPLAVGAGASRLLHHRVKGRPLRTLVLLFAAVSGTVLIFRG